MVFEVFLMFFLSFVELEDGVMKLLYMVLLRILDIKNSDSELEI